MRITDGTQLTLSVIALVVWVYLIDEFSHHSKSPPKNGRYFNRSGITDTHCFPHTQNTHFENFLVDRWIDARTAVNLSSIRTGGGARDRFKQFHGFMSGVLFWNVNRTIFSYARIFKCEF
jgi:hypothetical protein